MHASTKPKYIVQLIQAHTRLSAPQTETETETLFTSSQNLMQVLLFSSRLFLNLSSYSQMVTAESEIYFYNENVALLSSKL